ncbi:MAG TPA: acetate kinase [Spirochaetota bacterium]|nr:acetate kinase [Spirochaetota bacterium]HOM38097.1 acetate kinase [Spirochaetota bacterium]HPQ48899.1 acetate kinase [Spirochaetota bacterium]
MNVMVLNCGSSSLKYQLINMEEQKVLAKGLVERIGLDNAIVGYEPYNGDKVKETVSKIENHEEAIKIVLNKLVDPKIGVIKSLKEIVAVGHRTVHGADKFTSSVLITKEVINTMKECIPLAPLHNPANIMGIEAMMHVLPDVPNVGVFDTAFHQTMPEESFIYAIPYELYEKNKVRRYGFHGTSHRFVSMKAAEYLGIKLENFNCITCHMGNGSSFAAIKDGKSYDTTMGMTPVEGLIMGTRSGDIDAGILFYLNRNLGMSIDDLDNLLNKKSGLLGISGVSSDMRDIEDAAKKGNKRAQLAIDALVHRTVKYIGAYIALLGRVDAIIFTGGIGENAIDFRAKVVKRLEGLGIKLDEEKNNVRGQLQIITKKDSSIKVMIVPTNEELMIALDTKEIVSKLKK